MARALHNLESAGSFTKAITVVPNDGVDLPWTTRGIYIGGAGNLAVLMANDDDASAVILTAITPGTTHRLAVRRVLFTNTTVAAGLIIALA